MSLLQKQHRCSLLLSCVCLAALVVMMMAATVLEWLRGTPEAFRWVYHNPVFFVLWAVTALSGLYYLIRTIAAKQIFTLGLHLGLAVILAGALLTHLSGESGSIHLREGEASDAWEQDDGSSARLPFSLCLEAFAIDRYPGSQMPKDYRSRVVFLPEGAAVEISMNQIAKYRGYRFYQADYDEDGAGSILAISHDPWGVGVTYAGYLMLLVSMIGFFFQPKTRFRAVQGRFFSGVYLTERLPSWLPISGAVLALLAWACLTVHLGYRWILTGTGPFVGRYNVMMLMAWFSLLVILLLYRKYPLIELLGFALAGITVYMALQAGVSNRPLMPVLRSPLLSIHVVSLMLSHTLFALTAFNGMVALAVPKASRELQDVSLLMLYPAVFLLSFGTFLGAVWANISWGSYWAWDPKETWALVTLLVYSFTLHDGVLKPFRSPRLFHAYTLAAFVCVLVTYFGVNLLLGGMHAYGS